MSHYKLSQAIRIYLSVVVTENTSLGIYTSGGKSEIRLSEEILSGVAESWTNGLILENGISGYSCGGDTRRGGCVADYSGMTIQVVNVTRYLATLEALGVYLQGCACEIYEFSGTEVDSDAEYRTVIFTGSIEDIRSDEINLGIPVKNNRIKRNAPMSEPLAVNSSDIVPMTFGKMYPEDPLTVNNLAKFVRLSNSINESIYTDNHFTGSGGTLSAFPVAFNPNPSDFIFSCKNVTNFISEAPEDCYLVVVDGEGKDQIRKVTAFVARDYGVDKFVICYIDKVFLTPLKHTGSTLSWVKFIEIKRVYCADSFKCKSFNLSDGTATDTPEINSYDEDTDKYGRITDFCLTADLINNNNLDIDGSQYSGDIDTIDSFIVKTVPSIYASTSSTLSEWDYDTETLFSGYTKTSDGLYLAGAASTATGSFTDSSKAIDKLSTTYATFDISLIPGSTSVSKLLKVINFDIPKQPDIKWDKVYIGVKLDTYSNKLGMINGDSFFRIMLNTFDSYKRYTILNDKVMIGEGTLPGSTVDCIPDKYWIDGVDTNDINFYREPTALSPGIYDDLTGYTFFEISGCTKENYSALTIGGLFFGRSTTTVLGNGTDTLKLYDVSFIFKKSGFSIKKDVFTPMAGRIYNSTWGTRVTSTDMIPDPVAMIEHCRRLGNWSETGETAKSWGREYAAGALIKTGAGVAGSFDNAGLTASRAFRPAFQIFDEAQAYTNALTQRLCETYNLFSAINKNGYECIYPMIATSPSETITYDHIPEGADIGEVIEPQIQDVFCEPIVNYCYNSGSGKFDKHLRVKDIQKYALGGTWSDSSSGFASQAAAESVLNICETLYNRFKQVEPCPSDFSDQKTITLDADAVAYLIIKLNWMAKSRISIPVFYGAYRSLSLTEQFFPGQHVNIALLHQTSGVPKECFIERASPDKNNNVVKLDLVIL